MRLEKSDQTLKEISSLFGKKAGIESDPKFMVHYQHSDSYGIKNNNILTEFLMTTTFNCRVFTKRTKMAVLSYPEKITVQNKLVNEVFKSLHKEGIPFVNAEPKKEANSRLFDFDNTVYKKIYRFNHQAIKNIKIPAAGTIKKGSWSDLIIQNGAAQLYEVPLHTTDERNTMNRPYWWWNLQQKLNPERKLAVYFGRIGLPQAYMFYELDKHTINVEEFYGTNNEGVRGLLGFLSEIGNQDSKYKINMPSDSHLEDFFTEEEEIEINIVPQLLSRILDFPKILSFMKLTNNESFTVKVEDDQLCPWNNGTWKVSTVDDKLQVIPFNESDEMIDFCGKIATWTKILLGEIKLKEAVRWGGIKGNKDKNVDFVKGTVSFFEEY